MHGHTLQHRQPSRQAEHAHGHNRKVGVGGTREMVVSETQRSQQTSFVTHVTRAAMHGEPQLGPGTSGVPWLLLSREEKSGEARGRLWMLLQ